LEFSSLILVGAGLIGIGFPIICNAANLGFRKSAFKEVGGYSDNLEISSGDDEFLMQKIARHTNFKVKFCLNNNAISYTDPNESLSQFYHQRKRWASKGFLYKDFKITFKLIMIFLFYLGIPLQFVIGIFYDNLFLYSGLIIFIFKFISEYKFITAFSDPLFENPKISLFFFAEILHIPYIIIAGFSGIFGNYKWKGRNIRR
jgi:cellulose synthase/poly-beta-1,6-N-acetylglucosamine synthase-like glycosyltransferase